MDTEEKKELETIKAPAELPAITSPGDIYFNLQLFEHVQRVATMFARSNMIPDRFKGNVGDCTIALSMAHRLKADPIMVMQNTYVVHGSPGIQGQFVIALINQCGKFSQLVFREVKNEDKEVISCTAHATLRENGEELSTELTWEDVVAQGWNKDKKNRNTGAKIPSKWNIMRPQMFRYRAAAFFGRTFCPEVLFGMQTTEELHDVIDVTPDAGDKLNAFIGLKPVKDKIAADFQENLKEELSKEKTDEETIVVAPKKEEPVIEEKPDGSEAKEQSSAGGEDLPESTDNNTDDSPGEVMTSDHQDHPFNRTRWIACRAASTLEKLVKDDAESWLTTTKETKIEFFEKWKRILKSSAMELWPFEDPTALAQKDEDSDGDQDRSAEAYINIFKGCESVAKLEEWFKANSDGIMKHPERDIIIAEYDRLLDANEDAKELVTAQDFLKHIYHAENTSELSMVGMKYGETIDALPESEEIWNRLNEKTTELNNK